MTADALPDPASTSLRILLVTRQLPPHGVGGIGTYVGALAPLLVAAGHDVTVLSAAPGAARSTTVVDGVRVERFGVAGPSWLWRVLYGCSFPPASRLHAAVSAWLALRRLDVSFDAIEAPEWKAEGWLLPACRKGPVIVHLHLAHELVRRWGREEAPGRGVRLAEWLERRSVDHAAAVTATSELSSMGPDGHRWVPSIEVTRVPPPIVPQDWSHVATVAPAAPPVVLFVGHLEHRKAPEVLLEALGLLASEVPDLRGVFVGRAFSNADGVPYDRVLTSRAEALKVHCEVYDPRPPRPWPTSMRWPGWWSSPAGSRPCPWLPSRPWPAPGPPS